MGLPDVADVENPEARLAEIADRLDELDDEDAAVFRHIEREIGHAFHDTNISERIHHDRDLLRREQRALQIRLQREEDDDR